MYSSFVIWYKYFLAFMMSSTKKHIFMCTELCLRHVNDRGKRIPCLQTYHLEKDLSKHNQLIERPYLSFLNFMGYFLGMLTHSTVYTKARVWLYRGMGVSCWFQKLFFHAWTCMWHLCSAALCDCLTFFGGQTDDSSVL